MHMADALLSPAVGGAFIAVSAGALAYSVAKIAKDDTFDEKKIPMMGVMGAFVFAAQMINFTIPGTGSSGHIGGGILLAALLGPYPALLTISAVLIIQCLFFADGGLLALGCNIFNMGIVSCLVAYPLIYKPIVKKGLSVKRIAIGSILAIVIGLQLGAFMVVMETLASGITELPFTAFIALMQPIHLAIGIVEGIVTALVLGFVFQMRPEILDSALNKKPIGAVSIKKVVGVLIIVAIITGGALSLFASSFPDGLEWSMEGVAGTAELEADSSTHDTAADIQESTAFMPDYAFKSDSESGTSAAGLIGGTMTLALAAAGGLIIYGVKKRKKPVNSEK